MKIRFTDKLSQDKLYSENLHTINVNVGKILEVDSYREDDVSYEERAYYYTIIKDGIEYDGVPGEWFEIVHESESTVIKDKPDYRHIFIDMLEYFNDTDTYEYSKGEKNFVVFFDVNLMDSMSGLREFDQAILNINTGDLIFMNFSPVFKIETRIIENKSYIIEETIPF